MRALVRVSVKKHNYPGATPHAVFRTSQVQWLSDMPRLLNLNHIQMQT